MPRKSIVKTLLRNYRNKKVILSTHPTKYLILYEFNRNPSPRFYKALEELNTYFKITRVQKGVLRVETVNIASIVVNLIARYKGKYRIYSASEIPLHEFYTHFKLIDWSGTGLRS